MTDRFVTPPSSSSLEGPPTSSITNYERMASSPTVAVAPKETMTSSTTTTHYQPAAGAPAPTGGFISSPLTFETTSQEPQGAANPITTVMGLDTIPSKLASRSFGSIRSNRSRRSTRSRDSARSQYNNRIVYSTTAHYDTWMIFLLSLPLLALVLWMIVVVTSSKYDHWERSPTVWILSWSLLLMVGLYMVLLPKQLNIRSNGSLGIKTFLCTFQFSNVCHVSRGSTTHTTSSTYPTPTGVSTQHYHNYDNNYNYNAMSPGGCCGPLRVHRLGTSWTSIPCILRRRRRHGEGSDHDFSIKEEDIYPPPPPTMGGPFEFLWDVHVTPHNPTEFIQHYESVLTRLEIQRASANATNNNAAATTAAAPPMGGSNGSNTRMMPDSSDRGTPFPVDRPPLSVVTATFV